jgi:Ca-activated chloride channel family protein
MDVHLQNIHMLYLLWLLPVMLLGFMYAGQKRRQTLELFAQADLLKQLNGSVNIVRRRWKLASILIAVTLIVMGLTRPSWNLKSQSVERKGRDVVFLLDVSQSMMAEDLKPNRLERAKLAIIDCIEKLQGDRVALVAFSGNAAVKCPLTLDYGFFRTMLENLSPRDIDRGGTMIGDALRTTMNEVFDNQSGKFKDIVLITDGEDHDSFPAQAAEELGKREIRLIAVGLGDENQGRRIPITDEQGNKTFLKYQGQEVWSKLDASTLRKMVDLTPGGKYFNVSTGTIDLGSIYSKLIASSEKKELEAQTIKQYEEKFQIFLAIAFIVLSVEAIVTERKKRENNGHVSQ